MATYHEVTKITKQINEDGTETVTEATETHKIDKSGEPDYIKIYTDMWCSYNAIPDRWRSLFLQLAIRMTYADATSREGGQVVNITGPTKLSILKTLGWKENNFRKGIQKLCECHAIRRISRGWYQINPSYAGRGEWRYNTKKEQGGIENIITKFNFKDKTVDTQIIFAEDDYDDRGTELTIKQGKYKPDNQIPDINDQIPGQMDILDLDIPVGDIDDYSEMEAWENTPHVI